MVFWNAKERQFLVDFGGVGSEFNKEEENAGAEHRDGKFSAHLDIALPSSTSRDQKIVGALKLPAPARWP